MIYDYQNCIDYAVEQAVEKAVKKAAKENLEKGLTQGEAKGKSEAKIETAKNLLKMGLTLSQISLATGLPENEINKLINR